MCRLCHCPDYCGCNPTCFCGFIIPLELGTVFAAVQIMLCGLSFPAMSLLFWPQINILAPSIVISILVFFLAALLLINMKLKKYIIFRIVIYGIPLVFVMGCIGIIAGLNADFETSSRELVKSFRKLFNFTTREDIAFQMLQSIQIVYYSILFFSYVYCGMVFQLYEIKHRVKRRRRVVDAEGSHSWRFGGWKMRKPGNGEPSGRATGPKEKKTVRIVLPQS